MIRIELDPDVPPYIWLLVQAYQLGMLSWGLSSAKASWAMQEVTRLMCILHGDEYVTEPY